MDSLNSLVDKWKKKQNCSKKNWLSKTDFAENAYRQELALRGLKSVAIDFFTPPPPRYLSYHLFFSLIILVVTVKCDNKFLP